MPTLVITGASTGIGAATAKQAAQAGWDVALAARSEDKLKKLAEEIGEEHALVARCDVTEWGDQQRLVAETIDRFGGIDAVFANAGFGAKRGFLEEDPDQWRSMVLTNVLGPELTIRAVLPHFLERDAGHVVITSSEAGRKRASKVIVGSTVPTTAFSGMTSSRADPRGMPAVSVSVRGTRARRTSRAAT